MAGLTIGTPCPDLTLASGSGQPVHLREAASRGHLVLVFYHLAFTGG